MTHDQPARLEAPTVPLDPRSAQTLAAAGLGYRVVDPAGEAWEPFATAVDRGFLGERSTPEQVQGWRTSAGGNRSIGVYDDGGVEPAVPVATTASWVMDLTVDPGAYLPMWSISAVTVSPTHRRRGIARSLLQGELRAAAAAGLPIAGLTVSEATIYGRFGFGPAVHTADWRIDARRAGWVGPVPTGGRLDQVERETLRDDLADLNARTRDERLGDIDGWPGLWRSLAGINEGKPDNKVRGVRWTDADGVVRGVLAYTITSGEDFTRSTLDVRALVADGVDAYAALWRYALTHDLVGTVTTSLRSIDEPLRWMIADERALVVTERDHHWLRVLDVAACLQARRYRVPGAVVLQVADPLRIAGGSWRLQVGDDGVGRVPQTTATDGAPVVRLGVSELSSMLLGGVRPSVLRAAGRIACDAETAAWLDVAFTPARPLQLSYWY